MLVLRANSRVPAYVQTRYTMEPDKCVRRLLFPSVNVHRFYIAYKDVLIDDR